MACVRRAEAEGPGGGRPLPGVDLRRRLLLLVLVLGTAALPGAEVARVHEPVAVRLLAVDRLPTARVAEIALGPCRDRADAAPECIERLGLLRDRVRAVVELVQELDAAGRADRRTRSLAGAQRVTARGHHGPDRRALAHRLVLTRTPGIGGDREVELGDRTLANQLQLLHRGPGGLCVPPTDADVLGRRPGGVREDVGQLETATRDRQEHVRDRRVGAEEPARPGEAPVASRRVATVDVQIRRPRRVRHAHGAVRSRVAVAVDRVVPADVLRAALEAVERPTACEVAAVDLDQEVPLLDGAGLEIRHGTHRERVHPASVGRSHGLDHLAVGALDEIQVDVRDARLAGLQAVAVGVLPDEVTDRDLALRLAVGLAGLLTGPRHAGTGKARVGRLRAGLAFVVRQLTRHTLTRNTGRLRAERRVRRLRARVALVHVDLARRTHARHTGRLGAGRGVRRLRAGVALLHVDLARRTHARYARRLRARVRVTRLRARVALLHVDLARRTHARHTGPARCRSRGPTSPCRGCPPPR